MQASYAGFLLLLLVLCHLILSALHTPSLPILPHLPRPAGHSHRCDLCPPGLLNGLKAHAVDVDDDTGSSFKLLHPVASCGVPAEGDRSPPIILLEAVDAPPSTTAPSPGPAPCGSLENAHQRRAGPQPRLELDLEPLAPWQAAGGLAVCAIMLPALAAYIRHAQGEHRKGGTGRPAGRLRSTSGPAGATFSALALALAMASFLPAAFAITQSEALLLFKSALHSGTLTDWTGTVCSDPGWTGITCSGTDVVSLSYPAWRRTEPGNNRLAIPTD